MTIATIIEESKSTANTYATAELDLVPESIVTHTVVSDVSGSGRLIDTASIRLQLETLEDDDDNSRKTSLCLGSCCDVRTTCIIVDSIYLFSMIGALIAVFAGFGGLMATTVTAIDNEENDNATFDDDNLFDTKEPLFGPSSFLAFDFQLGLGVVFGLIGLLGAIRFLPWLVLVHAIWLCIDTVLYGVCFNWFSALVVAAYSYPHFALFIALRKGTLTRKNYLVTEKYCCCIRDDVESQGERRSC